MKGILIYSASIWFTGILLGPAVYYLLQWLTHPGHGTGARSFSFYYEIIFSLPGLFLFMIAAGLITRIPVHEFIKRSMLSIIAAGIIILLLYPLVPLLHWTIAYCIVVIPGVWFYPLTFKSETD